MSLTSNRTCSICHRHAAKWLCNCGSEIICQEGPCLAAHMSRADRSHLLIVVERGVELLPQEAEGYLKSVDAALEAVDFVCAEEMWLRREREKLAKEIDRMVENYANRLRTYAEKKKKELDRLLAVSIGAMNVFKTPEKRDFVFQMKEERKHLASLTCQFEKLKTDGWIKTKGSERRYPIATRSEGLWGFGGAFDAISFTTSKGIVLTGVSLCKGQTKKQLSLHSLEILKGNSTTSEVIYSDTEKRYMDSSFSFKVEVALKSAVLIDPNQVYTIKVQMIGCSGHSFVSLKVKEQDGLMVTLSNTIFNGGEQDNHSCVDGGVFYELLYLA